GADLVREAHTFGMRIGAWLTDDPSEAARLFDMGVDAVATNDPAVLIDVRRATS
ncbi:MAG: Glycerophosphoryl diester phosphodiesterase family, partial [Actinomycetota bacterium]|nr:Glycerophosphoryl diester phosphodiesterase family [Actinomycetota bacterium]